MKIGFETYTLDMLVGYYVKLNNLEAAVLVYVLTLKCLKDGKATLQWIEQTISKLGLNMSRQRIGSLLTTWKMHRFVTQPRRGVYTLGPRLKVNEHTLENARKILVERIGVEKIQEIEKVV